MKLKLTRWFLPSLVALFLTLFLVTPCLAINPPDKIDILGVWAYRNCRETGDQLYLVEYSINYTSTPGETATVTYFGRLMDGTTELASTTPYSYFNQGYGKGVLAIYFDADDAPTWQGFYTMKFVGNPFLSWNGTIPEVSYTPFDVWQDNEVPITRTLVASRILYLAQELEDDWGREMVEVSNTGATVLTTYAIGYFANIVPYLWDIASAIIPAGGYPSQIIQPELPPEQERTDYADSLVTNIIGTPLDMTNLANAFGVSRGALTAILYYGMVVVLLIVVARRIGSYRPVMLFGGFLMIVGSFVGVPLIAAILGGLMGLVMIGYVVFYKYSSA